METRTTSPSVRQQIDDDGFAVVSNVLSRAAVAHLVAAIDEILCHAEDRGDHAIRNLARAVPAVREAATSAAVQNLLRPFFESPPFLARSIFFDKTVAANWKVAWHQDLTIAVKEKVETQGFTAWSVKDEVVHVQPPARVLERMLTVRLHLDDCGPENGPLQVIPGSHRFGRLNTEQIMEWKTRGTSKACAVKQRGALLMRPLVLHASSSAVEPKHRRVVHLEFASDPLPNGMKWLEG